MAVDLELAPKQKRPAGEPCCEPVVYPEVEREQAERMATIAKALGDPIRLQLVDVLRKHAGKVCVCELVPLFDLSPAHRLAPPEEAARRRHRRLRAQGLWAYYYVNPEALEEVTTWLKLRDLDLLRARRPGNLLRAGCQERHAARGPMALRHDGAGKAESDVRERVRERYAGAAKAEHLIGLLRRCRPRGCGADRADRQAGHEVFGAELYTASRDAVPMRRSWPRSDAGTRPRSPTCTRARRCSTSARAAASTC